LDKKRSHPKRKSETFPTRERAAKRGREDSILKSHRKESKTRFGPRTEKCLNSVKKVPN